MQKGRSSSPGNPAFEFLVRDEGVFLSLLRQERFDQFRLKGQQQAVLMERRPVDEEDVLGAFAQGRNLRGLQIDAVFGENLRDCVEKPDSVRTDEIQNESAVRFVRVDVYARAGWEVS